MLPDPIVVDANTPNPALNFSVIRSDGYGAERRDPAGLYNLVINHSTSKNGDRHYLKISKTIDATNPYNDLVSPQSASISISFSRPPFGFTDTHMGDLWTALQDTLAADGVSVADVLAFQS
jgi:hypothetical protein